MSIKPRSTDRPLDILLLTPDKPYPSESGAALRNWGIIKGLSDGDHRLTLLSFSDMQLDPNANPLFRHCREVITCSAPHRDRFSRIFTLLTSGRADIETRLLSDGFQRALERTLSSKSFDIIQFSGIEMACFLPAIQARKGKARVIYDALNAEADLQRIIAAVDRGQPRRILKALYSTLQARRLQRFESELCQAVDAVVAVSDEDKSLLSRHAGAPIFVLPNGIFADEYVADCPSKRDADTLVFSGKMDYRPNVDAVLWFTQEIMPRLQEERPALKLLLVGRNPNARLLSLAEAQGVEVTGWVESTLPYLMRAALFVLPMRMGSGTRLKALEAMASGCAVVSTSLGASGLRGELRGAVTIADDSQSFAHSVLRLLDDKRAREQLGARGQALARSHYDWSRLMPRLLDAYRAILND